MDEYVLLRFRKMYMCDHTDRKTLTIIMKNLKTNIHLSHDEDNLPSLYSYTLSTLTEIEPLSLAAREEEEDKPP